MVYLIILTFLRKLCVVLAYFLEQCYLIVHFCLTVTKISTIEAGSNFKFFLYLLAAMMIRNNLVLIV